MSLEGRLEDLGLPDIFQILNLSKRSGVLTLIKKDGMGRVVFNQGNVVYASSDNKSRFGYALLQRNLITRGDLERALSIQKARAVKRPIGTILVEMGVMGQEQLETELRTHIVDVVRDLMTWAAGTFQFTLGKFSDEGVLMRSGISAEFLLLEGARLDDEADGADGADAAIMDEQESAPLDRDLDESTPMSHPVAPTDAHESLAGLVTGDELGQALLGGGARASRRDLELLPAMIEDLSRAVSGHDVILLMLRFAGELMNRSVMFLVRGETVTGWGQLGVERVDESADEIVRSIALSLSEASSFREVADSRTALKGKWPDLPGNSSIVERLGGSWPAESFLAPVMTAERVVAFLYGDNVPNSDPIGDTEGLEAFLRVAAVSLGKTRLHQQLDRIEKSGS
ncbi:MAG: DUF4388 domain-containing protein [Nitrospirota bacterium]